MFAFRKILLIILLIISSLLIANYSFVETIFYMAISPKPVMVEKQEDLLNSNRKLVNLMQYR